jgi:hypothetical protein
LCFPKVERPEQVVWAAERLVGTGIRLQALIETPAGSLAAAEIACAHPSLEALILGYADLGTALGRRGAGSDPRTRLVHQERVLGAARIAQFQAHQASSRRGLHSKSPRLAVFLSLNQGREKVRGGRKPLAKRAVDLRTAAELPADEHGLGSQVRILSRASHRTPAGPGGAEIEH